jgi:gliding motility-associated-like protein
MNYNLGPNPFTDSVWHYLAVTQEFSTREVKIYVDGMPMSFTEENVPGLWISPAILDDWHWGANPYSPSRYFLGEMDEIRVQAVVRSEDWLKTEYRNQNNPDGFYSISEETAIDINPTVCEDAGPVILDHAKPAGGSYSGTGVVGGSFYPATAGPGDHTINYNYTDGNGCSASGSEILSVIGLPAPSITGNSSICSASSGMIYSTADVPGNSYNWVITGEGAAITGGQGTNQITVDWGSSSGTVLVTETIDETGCDSTSSVFYVTIGDTIAPVISCLDDLTELIDVNCEFTLLDYATLLSYSDNCDTSVNISQVPLPGTSLNGSGSNHEIVLVARDIGGNESECRFNLLLLDNISPSLSGSLRDTTIFVEEGIYEAYVSLPVPDFSDNCGIASIINDFNGAQDASGNYPYGSTTITYRVTDVNGNVADFNHEVEVRFENDPEYGLIIPEGFSPNEDGLNDQFEILGIEQYPDLELRVFNVHGSEVYRKSNYDNSWDGKSNEGINNGASLPGGTYYYVIYLNVENVVLKGFVYLRRE